MIDPTLPTTPQLDLVHRYRSDGYLLAIWETTPDTSTSPPRDRSHDKGPQGRDAKGWTTRIYTADDYTPTSRVGIITGAEIAPGKFLHDVDIDYAPGSSVAQAFLPATSFVYGRASKFVSHCFYTTTEALTSTKYEDVDGTTLIELRGTKNDGTLGLQSMVPPSIWSKAGHAPEPLEFRTPLGPPGHFEKPEELKERVCLAAIGMLLAKNFGTNGFGHDQRLAWAGFLLRSGVKADHLIIMGEAISAVCNNVEVGDVRRVVESTAASLGKDAKTKGGPSLAKLLGEKGKAIVAKISEWLGRDSEFLRDGSGRILKDSQENIRRALTLLDLKLSYNEFSGKILLNGAEISDQDYEKYWMRVDSEFHFRPTQHLFDTVLRVVAYEHTFHPVKQYLDSLTWDGTTRLDRWLVDLAGCENSEYVRAVSAIVLIAAVRRVRQPGCKFDELLVLESRQGLNKSTALKLLPPKVEWFSDDLPLNVDGKQIIERTRGKWIIEVAELVGRRSDREHLKAMLSRSVDTARLAYGRTSSSVDRQWLGIGTTNIDDYLTDPTGSRRFWPVRCQMFDLDKLVAMRDQLWAEAAAREAKSESHRLPEHLWPVAGEQQKRRHEGHAFEDTVREVLLAQPVILGRRRVTSEEVWASLGIELKDRPRAYKSFSEVLTRFGFRKTTMRVAGQKNGVSGYVSIDVGDPLLQTLEEEAFERQIGDEDGDTDLEEFKRKKDDIVPF